MSRAGEGLLLALRVNQLVYRQDYSSFKQLVSLTIDIVRHLVLHNIETRFKRGISSA